MNVRLRRCCKAAFALGALVLAAVALDAVLEVMRPGVMAETAGMLVGRGGQGVREAGEGAGEGMEVVSDDAVGAYETLPEGFADEVLSMEGYNDVRVNVDGSVVGFSTRDAPPEAFAAVRDVLAGRGWRAVPSGGEVSGSFVKEAGPRTWAYVACVRVGDTTSVVVQCAVAGEEGERHG